MCDSLEINDSFDFGFKLEYFEKYQPSGAGVTRSPPSMPHCLQHLTAGLIQNGQQGLEKG